MKTMHKFLFILILLPIAGKAFHGDKDYTKEKNITKVFSVNSESTLAVSNSYGNINVYLWDENKISIQVQIKVSGNSEKKVIERLEDIDVNFNNTSSRVMVITELNGTNWRGNSNLSYEINYIVKIPKNASVDLTNKYGNISIDKLNGNLDIDSKYGSLFLGQINGKTNRITMAYSQNSSIASIEKLQLNSQYSEIDITNGEQINVSGNYNTINYQTLNSLQVSSNYTKIKGSTVSKTTISGNYLTIKLGTVDHSAAINSNYSDIQLDTNSKTDLIDINGNYSNSKITLVPDFAFDLKLNMKYGTFKENLGMRLKYTDKYEKNNTKIFTGYHISSGKAKVSISTNYGNVQLLNQ